MMRLRWIVLLLPVLAIGCSTENSSTLDAGTFGSGNSAVKSIFQQHCSSCHSYAAMSADDLVAAGVMVKGQPTASPIYYRLIGATGGPGPTDMPQSGGALNTGDVQTIYDFIQNAQ